MKTNLLKIFIGLIIGIQACGKIESVEIPEFDVDVEKDTYYVGDTVNFSFKGEPNFITMYSGLMGNDYGHIDGRTINISYLMNFDTQVLDGWQEDQLSILVSKDFDEEYTIAGVHNATWIDITNKFRMLEPQENRIYTSSGLGDFSDVLFNGENQDSVKVYFAVKQVVKDQTLPSPLNSSRNNTGSLNRIRGITIHSKSPISEAVLYNHSTFEWKLFSTSNKDVNRATLFPNYIELRANVKPNLSSETEDWVVSKQMTFAKILDVGPDWGKSIKSLNDKRLDNYQVRYDEAGDYTVTFIAFNANVKGRKEIVREIKIKVLPKPE